MEKEKKLIFLTDFYIFYESGVKNFLKWFISNCPNGIHLEPQTNSVTGIIGISGKNYITNHYHIMKVKSLICWNLGTSMVVVVNEPSCL